MKTFRRSIALVALLFAVAGSIESARADSFCVRVRNNQIVTTTQCVPLP